MSHHVEVYLLGTGGGVGAGGAPGAEGALGALGAPMLESEGAAPGELPEELGDPPGLEPGDPELPEGDMPPKNVMIRRATNVIFESLPFFLRGKLAPPFPGELEPESLELPLGLPPLLLLPLGLLPPPPPLESGAGPLA